MKKKCNETEKKCSKAEHEKKPAHTNEILFKRAEGGGQKRKKNAFLILM